MVCGVLKAQNMIYCFENNYRRTFFVKSFISGATDRYKQKIYGTESGRKLMNILFTLSISSNFFRS